MAIETGSGSPIGPETGETGSGSPIGPTSGGESGSGSPVSFSGDSPQPPLYFRQAYSSASYAERFPFDAAYPEDGGALVEVQGPWPIAGPYRVRLRDQDGNFYPGGSDGCYSGVMTQGEAVYTNGSRQFIRFAFPKCPRGTYDLVVDWDNGVSQFSADQAVRSVPRTFTQFAQLLLAAPCYGAFQERLT